jgi:CRISPR-associated protein Cas7/Csd2 subtype I-C
MARIEADSGKGLVTDVCLKRKQRNFFSLFDGEGNPLTNGQSPEGYDIFVKENAVLQRAIKAAYSIRSRAVLRGLLDELRAEQFLTREAEAEAFAELDSELPDEPAKCAKKVLEIVTPMLDFNPYALAVASKLREKQGPPPEVVALVEQYRLAQPAQGQPRPGEKETREAIEKAIKQSLPKGRISATLKKSLEQAFEEASPECRLKEAHEGIRLEDAVRRELCRGFIDIRAFGAVVSTKGPLEGSFYGQIRGPLQFTFSESLDKVLPLDPAITRCAVASEDEKNPEEGSGNRTMGRKHGIVYGLYRCHIYFSPAFAAKTGFTYQDLDNFFFALTRMFGDYGVDIAAARPGGMRLVGLVDFQHKDSLGNAPAHKLFELVKVRGVKVCLGEDGKPLNPQPPRENEGRDAFNGKWVFKSTGSEFPQALHDYEGEAPEGELHVKDGKIIPGENGEGVSVIRARRIEWIIPEVKSDGKAS